MTFTAFGDLFRKLSERRGNSSKFMYKPSSGPAKAFFLLRGGLTIVRKHAILATLPQKIGLCSLNNPVPSTTLFGSSGRWAALKIGLLVATLPERALKKDGSLEQTQFQAF
jgi:hypothetical protein